MRFKSLPAMSNSGHQAKRTTMNIYYTPQPPTATTLYGANSTNTQYTSNFYISTDNAATQSAGAPMNITTITNSSSTY